jgi:hypothetical protein
MVTTPEAGWYDDGTGAQRWWDGTRWTEHYVDLQAPEVELRTDTPAAAAPSAPGWYDDGRGRLRWWNGRQWTADTRFGEDARAYAGVVVDGRWIHFGAMSVPIADVSVGITTAGELRKRRSLHDAVAGRTLYGPDGRLPAGRVGKLDKRALLLVVEAPPQLWVSPVPTGEDAAARRFADWANTCSAHYRFR